VWSANGSSFATTPAPNLSNNIQIWAPFGSITSYLTITPGATGSVDTIVCSKNIRTIKIYTQIQTSTPSTSRWRTLLFLNGVVVANNWGSPPNNVGNQRVFSVLEYGGISSGTVISFAIENNTLPMSIQNNNSYVIIEYNI
jgi:hypothetical protein